MSSIISPILLDSTGQDINKTLSEIRDALGCCCQHLPIDDTITSPDFVWSSKKMVEAFTSKETITGMSVSFDPIAATPIEVITTVKEQTTLQLIHTNNEQSFTYEVVIPAAGTLNWATGELILENGAIAELQEQPIMALEGTNALTISGGTMEVKYHIARGAAEPIVWDVICGGTSAEEV